MNSSGSENSPITIAAYGTGNAPIIRDLTIYGNFNLVENITVDANKEARDAVRLRGAQNCTLRGLTVRNGTRDGIDIARARAVLVDSCHIHHFLAGSFSQQADAHGIVATRSQGITVRNTEIHQVSGDSFQADPARDINNLTNDILIENCHFWTDPLTEDFNAGWSKTDHLPSNQKQYPGENAIDTKVLTSDWDTVSRMRITLRNILVHGWEKDGFIGNKAVFNLKEKIEAVLDGITVYDSEIAFRIRGTRGNANVTIKNAVIFDCEKTVRAEDDLANLKIYNSTFGNGLDTQFQFAGGGGEPINWEIMNNAFVGQKPGFAGKPNNMVVLYGEMASNFIDATIRNYHLKSSAKLIEAGATLEKVELDRDGNLRTDPYDIGAYEYSTDQPVDRPPSPPENLRVVE
jgi:hypothetical protein